MRTNGDVYWSTSLPKDHSALHELDEYCKEWGGLTRSEATRRLLIEWEKLRRGKEISVWGSDASLRLSGSVPPEGKVTRRASEAVQKPYVSNMAAKAASRVLDE